MPDKVTVLVGQRRIVMLTKISNVFVGFTEISFFFLTPLTGNNRFLELHCPEGPKFLYTTT